MKNRSAKVESKMNIALCDDNAVFMEELYSAIEQCCARRDWMLSCTRYQQPSAILDADLTSVQVLFLDVDMPGINGLQVAHQLRSRYPELIIVFVTGFLEYAPAGYNVDAFRYLLKDHLGKTLAACLDDIWEKLYISQESIRIRQLDHMVRVRLRDILYFEGTPNRHVLLHSTAAPGGPIECIGNLSDFDSGLSEKGFLRIQKSFLVNMWHIDDIRNYTAMLDNGETLKVSRSNYAKICAQYVLWEGQHL